MAADNFKAMQEIFRNETWWPEYQEDYLDFWSATGASVLNCYYRDNIAVKNDRMVSLERHIHEDLGTNVNLLMIVSGADTRIYPSPLFHQSLHKFEASAGQLVQIRTIDGARWHSVLHGDHAVAAAEYISSFTKGSKSQRFSIFSVLTSLHLITSVPDEEVEDSAVVAAVFFCFLGLVAGFGLELHFGERMRDHKKLCLSVHVLFVVAGFASRTWTGYVLAVAGTFQLGYPEITSCWSKFLHDKRAYKGDLSSSRLKVSQSALLAAARTLHHSGGLLVIASSPAGLVHPITLLPTVIPLSVQRILQLIEHCPSTYCTLLLAMEVWFQLESFAVFPNLHTLPFVGHFCVLFSHYIFVAVQMTALVLAN